jgi:Flp pilus assembly protein TadG
VATRVRHDNGAAMVELALILPVLLVLLFGIIEFGRAYNATISMQAAAREGVRELALRRPAGEVDAAVRDAAPSVDIDSISQSACPATGDGEARVVVTEGFTFSIPFIPLGTRTLSATGVMRCGA